jgi:cellobiose-specific phosphotransferase system component IIC
VCSILIAMGIYWPFAKAAERQRLAQVETAKPAE